MSIKYTKDGKKVAVIGRLNSEEHIVQEIFIAQGQEMPAGENFVVKGLLDQPAESWKQAEIRKTEEQHTKGLAEAKRVYERAVSDLCRAKEKARLVSDALFDFAKGTKHEADIDTLKSFLSGEITHFFVGGYRPKIVKWDDELSEDPEHYSKRIEYLRLVSLFGKSDGSLAYKINTWRDGSGDSREIFPFTSYEAALVKAQAVCDEEAKAYLESDRRSFYFDEWRKIDGIRISQAAIDKHDGIRRDQQEKEIAELTAKLKKLEGEINA